MKYVAFLDILGFKEKIKNLSQEKATDYIARFSSTIYSKFENESNQIMGYIVSDSVILYTKNNSQESLIRLVKVIIDICHAEFAENGIIIRGAIAKGSFNRIPATELNNLQKGLIVGQAYVEAYTLEGSIKNIGITLSKSVFQDLENIGNKYKIIEEKNDSEVFYILRYITIDFLLDQNNLQKYVLLAKEAEWLPHYYNTIYFALKNESNDNKVEQLFDNILSLVCDDKPKENWRDLDIFIKNGFIRPNKEYVDPDYLVYYLLSPELQHKLLSSANGATVSHLNMSSIRSLEVQVPDIEVQKRIGAILARIDDKIELNTAINDNLRLQAA